MAWARSPTIRLLYRSLGVRDITSMPRISWSYSVSRLNRAFLLPGACKCKWWTLLSQNVRTREPFKSSEFIEVSVFLKGIRSMSTQVKSPPQMQQALKNAYAVAKLRKSTGYSKQKFYEEAIELYKELNLLIANGDKTSLRKAVTENMYSMGIDKNDLNKAFVQLTLEFVIKQKLKAYDSNYNIVAGDKTKEVFERPLFHPGSYWQLCGRISL